MIAQITRVLNKLKAHMDNYTAARAAKLDNLDNLGRIPGYAVPSNNVQASSITEANTNGNMTWLAKEFKVRVSGKMRLKFEMRTASASSETTATAGVKCGNASDNYSIQGQNSGSTNGSTVVFKTTSIEHVPKQAELYVEPGDVVQLSIQSQTSGIYCYVRNVELCYDIQDSMITSELITHRSYT